MIVCVDIIVCNNECVTVTNIILSVKVIKPTDKIREFQNNNRNYKTKRKMTQNSGNRRENQNYRGHHQHYQNHLRQDFDDDLNMDSNATDKPHNSQSESRPPQKDFRILRCFCGCSQLTFEQIEAYAMMNAKGIAQNEDSKKLLKTFLQIGHRSDKSYALLLLECYEYCERILNDSSLIHVLLDDLMNVLPSYPWEQKINDACEMEASDGINRQLEEVLNALQKECLCNIESDHDFARFRRELLRKIGK